MSKFRYDSGFFPSNFMWDKEDINNIFNKLLTKVETVGEAKFFIVKKLKEIFPVLNNENKDIQIKIYESDNDTDTQKLLGNSDRLDKEKYLVKGFVVDIKNGEQKIISLFIYEENIFILASNIFEENNNISEDELVEEIKKRELEMELYGPPGGRENDIRSAFRRLKGGEAVTGPTPPEVVAGPNPVDPTGKDTDTFNPLFILDVYQEGKIILTEKYQSATPLSISKTNFTALKLLILEYLKSKPGMIGTEKITIQTPTNSVILDKENVFDKCKDNMPDGECKLKILLETEKRGFLKQQNPRTTAASAEEQLPAQGLDEVLQVVSTQRVPPPAQTQTQRTMTETSDYGVLNIPKEISEDGDEEEGGTEARGPVKQPQKEELIVMEEEYEEWLGGKNQTLFNIFDLFEEQDKIKGYYKTDMVGLNIYEFNKAFLKFYTFIFIKYSQKVDKDQLKKTLKDLGNNIDGDKKVSSNKLLTMDQVKRAVKDYLSSLALAEEEELLSDEKKKLLNRIEEKVDKIVRDIMKIETQDTPTPQEDPPTPQEDPPTPQEEGESGSPQERDGGVDQEKGFPTPERAKLEDLEEYGATFIKKNGDEEITETLKIGTKYEYTINKIQIQKQVIGFELKSDKGKESYYLVSLPINDGDDGEESTDEEDEEGEESYQESIPFKNFYDIRFKNPYFRIIPEARTKRTPTSTPIRPPGNPLRGPRPKPKSKNAPGRRPFPRPRIPPSSPRDTDPTPGVEGEETGGNVPKGGGRKLRRRKRTNKKRRSVRKKVSSKRRTQKKRTQNRRTQKKRTQKKRNVNKRY